LEEHKILLLLMKWEFLATSKLKTEFHYLFSGLSRLLLHSNALAK